MPDGLREARIAFIAARWHSELVDQATNACKAELQRLGVDIENNVVTYEVPGSLEIPLTAKLLGKAASWDVIIAFGLVVDGGIYRHEFVAQAVLNGMMQVSLDSETPILSVVLTPRIFHEENPVQIEFFRSHLVTKGTEAAQSAVSMLGTMATAIHPS